MYNKLFLMTIAGVLGGTIGTLLGGLDNILTSLLIFMVIDYITGLVVAAVFHESTKSKTGALSSEVCFKGLIKKIMVLLVVIVAVRLDSLVNTNYIRDGVCIAFIVNEVISIIENIGLMGVPVPSIISEAIELLNKKNE